MSFKEYLKEMLDNETKGMYSTRDRFEDPEEFDEEYFFDASKSSKVYEDILKLAKSKENLYSTNDGVWTGNISSDAYGIDIYDIRLVVLTPEDAHNQKANEVNEAWMKELKELCDRDNEING